MILLLIILLFLLQVAILITLTGVRLADVINRGVATVGSTVVHKGLSVADKGIQKQVNKSTNSYFKDAHRVNRSLLKLSGTTLETAAETAYKVAMIALKSGLRVSYFLIGAIKNLLIIALGYVTTVDIIVFLVAVAGAYSYMSLAM